jgi:hypothetical protein
MKSKVCTGCGLLKSLNNFTIDKKGKFGHASKCKKCRCEIDKQYRENNRELETKRIKVWRKNNPEKVKNTYLKHRKENLERLKKEALEKQKKYRKDPSYKLKESIRNNIRKSMIRGGINKKTRTTQILGCSFDEFKKYIESKFEPWMTWNNRGLYNGELNYGWDLDHIIPISSAKTEEGIIKLNHYTNFQPLCSHINRDIKKNKF